MQRKDRIRMDIDKADPRGVIRGMMKDGNLKGLLLRAGEIHGHFCPGLASGVKATCAGFKRLGVDRSTGMEEIMAVVECNSCFVDGIQAVSGCTLGNNALVYKDFGKTAVTFYRRNEKRGVRVAMKSMDSPGPKTPEDEEARSLFERAVKKREKLSDTERARLKQLWTERAFRFLDAPEAEVMSISEVTPDRVAYAPIMNSATCAVCGEKVMESKVRTRNDEPICLACGKEDSWMVAGHGIRPVTWSAG